MAKMNRDEIKKSYPTIKSEINIINEVIKKNIVTCEAAVNNNNLIVAVDQVALARLDGLYTM